ncbi:MAG: primosomal protein DnaI [bacterium]
MKKLNDFLSGYQPAEGADDTIDRLLEDPIVNAFVLKNDLKHDCIVRGINNFFVFKESKDICAVCRGLYECKLATEGMTPQLAMYGSDVELAYARCRYNTVNEAKSRIDALYVPRKVFNADIADFDMIGPARKEVHRYMIRFLNEYSRKNPMKGMYLCGVYGSGKTYILACMANELAKKGYRSSFVYYPDLVRELKSAIASGDLEERIQQLKKVDVLFLDDIGGGTVSAFTRDEVLGPILQHRVLDELPTFFSSNLKIKTLIEEMMLNTSDGERSKAIRIVERIRELAVEIELTEKPTRQS